MQHIAAYYLFQALRSRQTEQRRYKAVIELLVSVSSLCCSLFKKKKQFKANFMKVFYQDGLFLLRISYATALGRIG